MIESFNNLFFALTILFAVKAPIYSSSTEVEINTKDQTISIYYSDLQINKEYNSFSMQLIQSIDSLKRLKIELSDFSLIENDIIQLRKRVDYKVILAYQSFEDVKNHFKIDLDSNQIFVHSNEIITINSVDSLNTDSDIGEKLTFSKSTNHKYKLSYNWELDNINMDLVPLLD